MTGRPVITNMGSQMHRTLDDMFIWDRDRKMKVFEIRRRRIREKHEQETEEMAKGGKFLNKESIKYLSKKENVEIQVEERLINFGHIIEAKKN